MSVTIPADVYELVRDRLKSAYVAEFGEDALSEGKVALSRDEFVAKYARNLAFWKAHRPEIELDKCTEMPPSVVLAAHAICSNAINGLEARVREMRVENEVHARLSATSCAEPGTMV